MTKVLERENELTVERGRPTPSLGDRVRSLRLEGRSGAAKANNNLLPWGLCVILLLMTAAFGYRTYRVSPTGDAANATSATTAPASSEKTSPAATSNSVASSGTVALQAKGYIIPAHQIQVSPKIQGILVWIDPRLEEGARFKENDILARVEDVNYKADRDRAKATLELSEQKLAELQRSWPEEIDQAKAELAEQEANLRQLKLDADRSQQLSRGNALAQKDFEQALYSYQAMEQRVARLRIAFKLMSKGPRVDKIKQAEAEVMQAKADLNRAQWNLENCTILAPVTGTVLTKKAEKGNLVIPSAFSSSGGLSSSLCDMADLADLEVDLKIQERDIANVIVGQKCTVMPEAYQNFEPFRKVHPEGYFGKVARMMPTADRGQSAIPVRVKIVVPKEEEGVYLKPDMGVIVNFQK